MNDRVLVLVGIASAVVDGDRVPETCVLVSVAIELLPLAVVALAVEVLMLLVAVSVIEVSVKDSVAESLIDDEVAVLEEVRPAVIEREAVEDLTGANVVAIVGPSVVMTSVGVWVTAAATTG